MRLSAVIITFNEEKNIARCIDSLRPVADEIVVLDALSEDRTREILVEKGVVFEQRPWAGFSDSKNYAHKRVTGDYILSIDADEALSPELQQSIMAFKRKPDADILELNRLTNYCGAWIRHGGWYPDYKYRLFRTGLASWQGSVHEQLVFPASSRVIRLKGDIYHYSYPTIESHTRKMFHYASLGAERDFAKGKRMNLLVHGLLKPWFAFFKRYVLRGGMFDGYYGFVIAVNSGFERFIKYARYRELKNQ